MRLKLYEDAIRPRKKTDSVKSDAGGTDEATSSDQPAEEDDEPHTEPADEGDEEDADSGYGSPAKSGVSTGKGKGLTKSKLKGLKGTNKKSVSSKDGDMDETSSYASKARTEMVHRVLEGLHPGLPGISVSNPWLPLVVSAPSWRKCGRSFSPALRKKHVSSSALARNMAYSLGSPESRCCRTFLDDDAGGSCCAHLTPPLSSPSQ